MLWVDLQCICFMKSFMLSTSFNIEVFSIQMDIWMLLQCNYMGTINILWIPWWQHTILKLLYNRKCKLRRYIIENFILTSLKICSNSWWESLNYMWPFYQMWKHIFTTQHVEKQGDSQIDMLISKGEVEISNKWLLWMLSLECW